MKNCPKCGKPFDQGAQFCRFDGTKLEQEAVAKPPEPSDPQARFTLHQQPASVPQQIFVPNQPVNPAPAFVSGASSHPRFLKDPGPLTMFVKVMFILTAVMDAVTFLSNYMQLNLLAMTDLTQSAANANDERQQMVGLASLGISVLSLIVFLVWVNRANKNCRGFGADDMEFTSGYSVGYFFIPFLNLYKPYKVMKEIWQVSTNPLGWRSVSDTSLVGLWWAFWIGTTFVSQIAFRVSLQADTLVELKQTTSMLMFANVIDLSSSLISLALVSAIYSRQRQVTGS